MNRLIVSPLEASEETARARRPSHVVSLSAPGAAAPLLAGDHRRLALVFNDIAEPREGLTPPTATDIQTLLDFAADWDGARPMLIHCWAGVSRSTAAAYVVACARSNPGREAETAARLRSAAPFATPNPLMIALADALLRRDGAMTRAIAAIGRGAETGLGAVFDLPC